MASLSQISHDLYSYHTTAGNKLTHAVGIPALALALFGIAISSVPIDLGMILVAVLGLAYVRWHPALAPGISPLFIPRYLAGARVEVLPLWRILLAGVTLQYSAHVIFEKKQPAFHRNAIHMMVGPLWVASSLLCHVGLYRPA